MQQTPSQYSYLGLPEEVGSEGFLDDLVGGGLGDVDLQLWGGRGLEVAVNHGRHFTVEDLLRRVGVAHLL